MTDAASDKAGPSCRESDLDMFDEMNDGNKGFGNGVPGSEGHGSKGIIKAGSINPECELPVNQQSRKEREKHHPAAASTQVLRRARSITGCSNLNRSGGTKRMPTR